MLSATETALSAVFALLSSCPGSGGRPSKDGLPSHGPQHSACCAGCGGLPSCEDQPSREGLPSADLRQESKSSREGLPPRGRDTGMLDSAEAQSSDCPSLEARENTLPACALL